MSGYWWDCPDCGKTNSGYGDGPDECRGCNPICESCGGTARFIVRIAKADIVYRFCGECLEAWVEINHEVKS